MIDKLNKHLALELAATNTYHGHAALIEYHGYAALAKKYKEEAKEERGHANKIMRRIQQLGGIPAYTKLYQVTPCSDWDIRGILTADLTLEETVHLSLNDILMDADSGADGETSNVLRDLIKDTADHIQWLEVNLALIEEIGLQNWLQAQL